ncbi:regulatory protein RecX [Candidatus Gottesmanbacteria bacterium]|nr:regulatory protein RecX [Candidatus Gottesmanbacteria bacterium]
MIENGNYQKLRNYALRLLSIRPRSIEEIKGKLLWYSIKKGISNKLVGSLIEELLSQNLINDEEFAIWWIEQRRSFRPKGKRLIKLELLEKKVDREIIDKMLEKKEVGSSEFELGQKLVSKKASLFKNETAEVKKRKIANLLLRRGFDWGTISKVIDSVFKKS